MTKYEVKYSNTFKKSLKKVTKQNKNLDKMFYVIEKLANKETLEPKYRNHNLIDDKYYKNCGECHIEPDWLLVYRYEETDIALSKDILVSGIQFDNEEEYTGDFENTNMYKFLNTYFIKDIQIEKDIDISKISGTYEEAMALIEEAKRKYNAILNKSIIGKSILDKDKSYIKIKK